MPMSQESWAAFCDEVETEITRRFWRAGIQEAPTDMCVKNRRPDLWVCSLREKNGTVPRFVSPTSMWTSVPRKTHPGTKETIKTAIWMSAPGNEGDN